MRRIRPLMACALLLAVLALPTAAMAAKPATTSPVTINGIVAESSGIPVPGASVSVYFRSKGTYVLVAIRTTSSDGSWSYGGKTGAYRFDLAAEGATPTSVVAEYPDRGTFTLPTTLICCGDLTGVVRDGVTGLPLAGASVEVYRRSTGGVWPSVPAATVVAPDGAYTFDDLETGVYRIAASADGHESAFLGGETPAEVTVARATSASAGDLVLAPSLATAVISGRITNATGVGLHGFVYLFKQQPDGTWPVYTGYGGYIRSVETAYDGTYEIADLELGTYRVRLFTVHAGSQWWLFQPSYDTAWPLVLDTPGEVVTDVDAVFPPPVP